MQFFLDVLNFCIALIESCSVFQYFFVLPLAVGLVSMACGLMFFGGDHRD